MRPPRCVEPRDRDVGRVAKAVAGPERIDDPCPRQGPAPWHAIALHVGPVMGRDDRRVCSLDGAGNRRIPGITGQQDRGFPFRPRDLDCEPRMIARFSARRALPDRDLPGRQGGGACWPHQEVACRMEAGGEGGVNGAEPLIGHDPFPGRGRRESRA